ncbi:hypothetical protein ACFQ9X_05750 [Catenulispora yoronensis]
MTDHATTINAPEGTPFLDVTRDFDATPAQLFRALTEPGLVARWLGPRTWRSTSRSTTPAPEGATATPTTADTWARPGRRSTACSTPWSRTR